MCEWRREGLAEIWKPDIRWEQLEILDCCDFEDFFDEFFGEGVVLFLLLSLFAGDCEISELADDGICKNM